MSTKTTFKRVALVAVAALGLGVVSSVAPATAASTAITAVSAGTAAPARVGVVSGTSVITLTHPSASATSFDVTAQITSAPTGSVNAGLEFSAAAVKPIGSPTYTDKATKTGVTLGVNLDTTGVAFATGNTVGTSTTTRVNLAINPDVAGTYTVLVAVGGSADTGWAAGLKSTTYTITTAGAPTAMTLTAINSTTFDADSNGSLVKVALTDAAGAATTLGASESLSLTASASATVVNYGGSNAFLSSSDFLRGFGMIRVTQDVTADTTNVITVAGSGVLTAALSSQTSIKILLADSTADTMTAGNATSLNTYGTLATNAQPVSPTKTTYGITLTAPTGGATETFVAKAVYTDTSGLVTGIVGAAYTRAAALAVAGTSVSFTGGVALGTTGQLTIVVTGATAGAVTRDYTGTASSADYTISAISPAAVTSALLGKNTFTAKVTDDYGVAVAGAAITGSISAGRNAASASVAMLSDASGYVTYSITDAGTSGTTDTVQFARTSGGGGAVTATITYGTVTVKTVTLTGGNTTAGVTATTPSVKDINAGDGAEGTLNTFTATVKDANGVLLAGVPVVFTVAGSGVAVLSTTQTVYTGSAGTAQASVYGWIAGTYTVTATAGGVAGTGTITFAQTAAGEERAISVSAEGPVVTAKVVDRFGNPVPLVTVYATKTGQGFFGTGVTKTSGTTDSAGTVEFVITGGSADVTVSTLNYAATAGTCPSGQTGALAGNLDCTALAADATAFTATTAGTAVKAEAGVGASLSAAGVSKATVAVSVVAADAASDAAAEATDAANAATDAANAAAEAADAATAAAQDAADAVAALSTQVSEMVNALKKQITALTNLVIKIQKKVRA
jgi:hypothetical protein